MRPLLLVGATIVAITGLIGYHRVYAPRRNEVLSIQQQIREEQASQAALQGIVVVLKRLEQYRKRLPTEPDPSWLVREVVQLAQDTGVQFTTIAQEPTRSIDQFTRLAVGLHFTATYHQLGAFLDRVERAEPFILIERVEVSGQRDTNGAGGVRIVLSTLYAPFPVSKPTASLRRSAVVAAGHHASRGPCMA